VEIQVFDQASNAADWLALRLGGDELQSSTWEETVRRIVLLSGGMMSGGVKREVERLNDEEADRVASWLKATISARKREGRAEGLKAES
jgi:hypothetical protein